MQSEVSRVLFQKIGYLLETSLMKEVMATPKPGLVDWYDNGAHDDMDAELFIKSAKAISPYLCQMCWQGYCANDDMNKLFTAIQNTGMKAEQAMFRETNGINTHKGAIFILGLIAAATGRCYRINGAFNTSDILQLCKDISFERMEYHFKELDQREPKTNGEYLYKQFRIKGIRGEAQNGFQIIKDVSFPFLRSREQENEDDNTRYVNTLLKIIATLQDTNVLARSNWNFKVQESMQKRAREILCIGGMRTKEGYEQICEWNKECIERHISPGGCADILAATIFLEELMKLE